MNSYNGFPIIVIADKIIQNKKHKKKRINKKWKKRYGFTVLKSPIEDGQVLMTQSGLYVNDKTYLRLKTKLIIYKRFL